MASVQDQTRTVHDQALLGGMVYLEGEFVRADVYIDGETISHVAIRPDPSTVVLVDDTRTTHKTSIHHDANVLHDARVIHDCSGFHVLPGLIDPHVHMALNVGAHTSTDDFYTGSRAALYGGITTIIDFLDPINGIDELEASHSNRMKKAQEKGCHCDYGFHATLGHFEGNVDPLIEEVQRRKLYGIKVFTTYSESGRMIGPDVLGSLLQRPVLTMVHAENDTMIDLHDHSIPNYGESRPLMSELAQLEDLMGQVGEQGRLYVVHVSSGSGVRMLAGRENVYVETCPHYLHLDDSIYAGDAGANYLMAPPLRSKAEQELLKECLSTPGEIDTIATDHCPFLLSEKNGDGDALKVPKGVGSIGLSFLLAYRIIGFDAVYKMSTRVADIFGIPQKGRILAGCDADFAIFDAKGMTQANEAISACDYSIYSHLGSLEGQFVGTMIRGSWGFKRTDHHGKLIRDGAVQFFEPIGKPCVPVRLMTHIEAYDYKTYHKNAYVLYDERIRQIGSMDAIKTTNSNESIDFAESQSILSLKSLMHEDVEGALLLPGLINFHTHLYSSLICGFDFKRAPNTFKELLEGVWWRLDRHLDLEDVALSAVCGIEKSLGHGVTGVFDHHASGAITGSTRTIENIMEAFGITGCTCFETSDRFDVDACIAENGTAGFLGLHAAMSLSDETMVKVADHLGGRLHLRFHIHVAESAEDTDAVERLCANGLLGSDVAFAEDSLLAHCVHINEADAANIAASKSVIVVNPRSNLNNGVGAFNYGLFRDHDIPVVVGTDGYGHDMARSWQDFYLTAKASVGGSLDPDDVRKAMSWGYDYFRRMTGHQMGLLEPGMSFDCIVVPYTPCTPMTAKNIFSHILFEVFEAMRPERVYTKGIERLGWIGTFRCKHSERFERLEQVERLWQRIEEDEA